MMIPHLLAGTMREHYIFLFSAAGAIGLTAGLVGSWVGAYLGARRAGGAAQLNNVEAMPAAQLTPVMQALDAIALEVERISEAQRFTTRVLSERQPVVLPRAEPRSITPH
ncbi:MAG: hypothetical protein M3Z05_10590 [Gemmatimonadota bacterium]|nr:hypothetical protein [Gemmatimonadota bacterium]